MFYKSDVKGNPCMFFYLKMYISSVSALKIIIDLTSLHLEKP